VHTKLARIWACQADNGADLSVVDEQVLRENFPSVVISASRTPNNITSITGSSNPIGEADLYVKYNGRASLNMCAVVRAAPGFPIMFGSPACKAVGLGTTGVANPSLSPQSTLRRRTTGTT
jgi:hypothetical protein